MGFLRAIFSGCAFAQYRSKESADQCIAAAQDESEVINLMSLSSFFVACFCTLNVLSCDAVRWDSC